MNLDIWESQDLESFPCLNPSFLSWTATLRMSAHSMCTRSLKGFLSSFTYSFVCLQMLGIPLLQNKIPCQGVAGGRHKVTESGRGSGVPLPGAGDGSPFKLLSPLPEVPHREMQPGKKEENMIFVILLSLLMVSLMGQSRGPGCLMVWEGSVKAKVLGYMKRVLISKHLSRKLLPWAVEGCLEEFLSLSLSN